MKHFKIIPTLFAITLSLFALSSANAQISASPCPGYTAVATGCVGACGNPSDISYTYTLCKEKKSKFCVSNDASSLCANHDAYAFVFVNGVFVASGNITAVGSSIGFEAECGSTIKVYVKAVPNGNPILCVWLGELDYSLRRA